VQLRRWSRLPPASRSPVALYSSLRRAEKPPNAATVARLASIGQLPDITPVGDTVSVNIAPVIAGSGRASSTVTHVLPAAAEASRAAYRAMVAKPEKAQRG